MATVSKLGVQSRHLVVLSDEWELVSVTKSPPISGSEKAAPLGESGGTGLLIGVAILGVALRQKVVVAQGMHLACPHDQSRETPDRGGPKPGSRAQLPAEARIAPHVYPVDQR